MMVFFKPNVARLLKCLLLISIVSLWIANARADNSSAKPIALFNKVKSLPLQKRVDTAEAIYFSTNMHNLPEKQAMHILDVFTSLARAWGDQSLECSVFEMRSNYYSVNKGFNSKSDNYYLQAIAFAQKNNLKLEEGLYTHRRAIYYSIFNYNTIACQYFLDAQEIFTQIGYSKVPDIALYLWQFAEFYYKIGDYDECKTYLLEALNYNIPVFRNRINMTNTIGLIYRNYNQFPDALTVFYQVLKMAEAGRDTAWIGIANGNIGSVYFMQKQYAKAIPYIQIDYNISLKYQEAKNAAINLLRLAQISIESNKLDEAYMQLINIEFLLNEDHTNILKYQADLYRLKAIYFERTGKLEQALAFRKKFEITKDSVINQDNLAAVDRVNLRWQMDQRLIQFDQLKANAQINIIKLACVILVLVILMITYGLRYKHKISQAKKDKEILLSEKSNVDEELKNATSALMMYTENLKRKNDIIEQFRKKIDHMQVHLSDQAEIEKLDVLVQNHIMTDETWYEFKRLFNKVHHQFFYNLTNKYPKLSVTDTRLLSLIKLGLNNREMASMLGITLEGIKKSKQRLRKKMNLAAHEDIEKLIAKL